MVNNAPSSIVFYLEMKMEVEVGVHDIIGCGVTLGCNLLFYQLLQAFILEAVVVVVVVVLIILLLFLSIFKNMVKHYLLNYYVLVQGGSFFYVKKINFILNDYNNSPYLYTLGQGEFLISIFNNSLLILLIAKLYIFSQPSITSGSLNCLYNEQKRLAINDQKLEVKYI